jgi:type IV secretory pathway VirB10-like protein
VPGLTLSPNPPQPPRHVQSDATGAITLPNRPRVPPMSPGSSQHLQCKRDGPRKRAAPGPSGTRKRPHTAATTPRVQVQDSSEDGDDENQDKRCAATSTGPIEFFTSDFEALEMFLRMRLEKLTIKPLRPIVAEWVKLLEPRRLEIYGPYQKQRDDRRSRSQGQTVPGDQMQAEWGCLRSCIGGYAPRMCRNGHGGPSVCVHRRARP